MTDCIPGKKNHKVLATVLSTQKKDSLHVSLLFVGGVAQEGCLRLKGECCPDVSELRGQEGGESKRCNLQAASWGPGYQISGFLELGEGVGDPRALVPPRQPQRQKGGILSLVGR